MVDGTPILSFNPYKVSNLLLKEINKYRIKHPKDKNPLNILGTSSKPNENAEQYDSLTELVGIFKDREVNIITFEPYTQEKLNVESLKHIYEHLRLLLFIGCPHDYVKNIRFHGESVIIDPWGVVNEKLEGQGQIIRI